MNDNETSYEVINNASCKHCGDVCPEQIQFQLKAQFCCKGCQTVYSILHANNMEAFYRINDSPGINMKFGDKSDLAYLDNVSIRDNLIDFEEGQHTKISFVIPQITVHHVSGYSKTYTSLMNPLHVYTLIF